MLNMTFAQDTSTMDDDGAALSELELPEEGVTSVIGKVCIT